MTPRDDSLLSKHHALQIDCTHEIASQLKQAALPERGVFYYPRSRCQAIVLVDYSIRLGC